MFKQVKNLKEKVSNKLLMGAITLDALLGNPSLTLAQGTEETAVSSPNYVVGVAGMALGSLFCLGGREMEKAGNEKIGKAFTYSGLFVLGATAGAYIF